MIRAGIIGAAGYAGAELIRILLNHPEVEITGIVSNSHTGMNINDIYPNFKGFIDMKCTDIESVMQYAEVIFSALPAGLSEDIGFECFSKGIVFIDLGSDFRINDEKENEKWYGFKFKHPEIRNEVQYGLPELFRKEIRNSRLIANPGCYPTSSILAAAPALKNKLIDENSIIIDSLSGVTGSGKNLSQQSHFPDCNESLKAYKVASHRHTPEIEQQLSCIAGDKVTVNFTPHLVPVNRGILSTIYCNLNDKDIDINDVEKLYKDFYKHDKFVRIVENGNPETKNVTGSNFCDIGVNVDNRTGRLILVSAIDNMIKGAAGQAVQNMNIIFGLSESLGIDFIPAAF